MSKPSRRPNREATKETRKQLKEKIKQSRKELLKRNEAEGIVVPPQISVSNALCPYKSVEEEQVAREEAVAAQVAVYRAVLPLLLRRFSNIADPRNPKQVKHKLTVLLMYGLLIFVFQMASRREANQEMSRPAFFETLNLLFPELETMPHADTLARLLARIDVQKIELLILEIFTNFTRKKKFIKYLISKCYPIAVDGTQKSVRDGDNWPDEWQRRIFHTKEGEKIQSYLYVLEANLVLSNGLTLPLMSEFVSHAEGDPDDCKQDCELKAFYRLAKRLKTCFPRLPIMILLDGLYPNGPLMTQCLDYNWQFMIVLPDECLASVWKALEARLINGPVDDFETCWKGRNQYFWWANGIKYVYDNKEVNLNVVVCEETYYDVDNKSGDIIEKIKGHVWISSHPLSKENVHERCNLGARFRWGIEFSNLTEKHGGYKYEHIFSYNWNAMKGYHYLMRLAHMLNSIALLTKRVAKQVRTMGIRAFLKFVRETCANRWLRPEWIKELLIAPFQFRFM